MAWIKSIYLITHQYKLAEESYLYIWLNRDDGKNSQGFPEYSIHHGVIIRQQEEIVDIKWLLNIRGLFIQSTIK
jgi:hypothetical protein